MYDYQAATGVASQVPEEASCMFTHHSGRVDTPCGRNKGPSVPGSVFDWHHSLASGILHSRAESGTYLYLHTVGTCR